MATINVIITTYNRDKMLHDLLIDIKKEKGKHKITTQIFDDHSTDYQPVKAEGYYYLPQHCGKEKYWMIWNYIFSKVIKAQYYVVLPDDVMLKKGFFDKAIETFESIKDPKKICLSLLTDKRVHASNWGSGKPKYMGDVIRTGWNDLCFISRQTFWKELKGIYQIPASRWAVNKRKSSGVGEQITYRLRALGFTMYHIAESLVTHGDHESKMNPAERLIHPLRT